MDGGKRLLATRECGSRYGLAGSSAVLRAQPGLCYGDLRMTRL